MNGNSISGKNPPRFKGFTWNTSKGWGALRPLPFFRFHEETTLPTVRWLQPFFSLTEFESCGIDRL